MRYIGTKSQTAERVYSIINSKIKVGSFCDPFGGMSTLGVVFKKKGYQVFTGDVLRFANYFQISRLEVNRKLQFRKLKLKYGFSKNEDIEEYLNNIKQTNQWFVKEYSTKRKFFTKTNAKKISICIRKIHSWKNETLVNRKEFAFLMSSLIESIDRVANTAGTYYAYLKQFNRKSLKLFKFRFLSVISGNSKCKSYLMNAHQLVKKRLYDIIYLDPPYNERCYSAYYHLPESIASGILTDPKGKAGINTVNVTKSDFNVKLKAFESFKTIIKQAKFRLLVFHYTDDGLIDKRDIRKLLKSVGNLEEKILTTKGYSTSKNSTVKNRLYIVTK